VSQIPTLKGVKGERKGEGTTHERFGRYKKLGKSFLPPTKKTKHRPFGLMYWIRGNS